MERSRGARIAAALATLAAVAVVLVVLRVTATPAPTAQRSVHSTTATNWVLPRLGRSGDLRLTDLRGKPLVVTFFASWCTACKDELPLLRSAADHLHGQVTFAGVNSEETGDGLAMARTYGIDTWPLAVDVDGAADSGLHDALGGVGMPITAFYSASGSVLFVEPAALTAARLSADLQRLYGVSVTLSG